MFGFSPVTFAVVRRAMCHTCRTCRPRPAFVRQDKFKPRLSTPNLYYSKDVGTAKWDIKEDQKEAKQSNKSRIKIYDYTKKSIFPPVRVDRAVNVTGFTTNPTNNSNASSNWRDQNYLNFNSSLKRFQQLNSTDGTKNAHTKSSERVIEAVFQKDFDSDLQSEKSKSGGDGGRTSWNTVKYSIVVLGASFTCLFGYTMYYLGRPEMDADGNVVIDEYSGEPVPVQYFNRAVEKINYYNKLIKEPSREKLLPDTLKPPYYQPPYTLVLEFTDVLVHPEWTYNTGWRFKKRPGLDQFLEALYTRYELVVYTAEMGMTVFPIMEALDRNNLISYKLVRDATNFVEGHHVKDLDKLNRDLSKVVVVDWNPESTKFHASNLFNIPRWNGNDDDTALFDLASFLLAISDWEVADVRDVLQHYSEYKDPLEGFKERQRQLAASQQQQQ